ncbi:MAG TPA: transposase [Kofleriaceae bacterium]|nr:transposase [Kofleriaceae bacterium]
MVLRTAPGIGNLRRRSIFLAIREGTLVAARRADFRIVELSIQRAHMHLIVEAGDKTALAKSLQGFQVSAARYINAALAGRRGAVFPDRYHAVMITTPRQMRHTLAYVLGNWRKHREDQNPQLRGWRLDCSRARRCSAAGASASPEVNRSGTSRCT